MPHLAPVNLPLSATMCAPASLLSIHSASSTTVKTTLRKKYVKRKKNEARYIGPSTGKFSFRTDRVSRTMSPFISEKRVVREEVKEEKRVEEEPKAVVPRRP